VNSEHRSRELIERFTNATNQLCEMYKDENGERAREIQSLGGPNEFAEFYSRLKVMKEAHRRNPNEDAMSLTLEFDRKHAFIQNAERIEKEMVRFTDEEGYGKFLDMHLMFDQFINLKGIKVSFTLSIDLAVLENRLHQLPREVRSAL
jgi:splicing factor 3A subunit 3